MTPITLHRVTAAAVILSGLLWVIRGAQADQPRPADVLVLNSTEPDTSQPRADGGLLLREIVRQAILVAARDELGLATRDATLREVAPGASGALDVRTSFIVGDKCRITLERGPADKREVVWQKDIPMIGKRVDYHKLVAAAGDLSRKELPDALRKAGYAAGPRPAPTASMAEAPIDDLLGRMELTSQFAALRRLHVPGRQAVEPARLGGLTRAYAHLGQMTAFHWGASHKAFHARALLYADRLVDMAPKDPAAHWHRAYARALAGFAAAAIESLAEADRLRAAMPEAARPAPPAWLDLIDGFCRRDFVRLAAAARPGQPAEGLATLLAYLTLEEDGRNATYVRFTQKAATTHTELYRLYDGIFASGQLGLINQAAIIGPSTLNDTFGRRLKAIPGVPVSPAELEAAGEVAEVATKLPPVAKALVAAGDPDKDRVEPSWAVLGRTLQDLQFAQAAREADHQRRILGWSADEVKDFVRTAMPAVADHPLRDFIVSYSVDPRRQPDAYRGLLQGAQLADLGPPAARFVTALQALDTADKAPGRAAARRLQLHRDRTADDLAEALSRRTPKDRPALAREFLEVSPYSPQPVVALIENDWAAVQGEAAEWEKRYAGSASVQAALGRKYVELKRPADAERCLRASARLSPDRATFQALAAIYKDRGDTARWQEALDDYLKTEDTGLAHAQVRVELARHFIRLKQFDKAKPYADAAAETAAAWAMLCAAEVAEGLKDYEGAEKWIRETAEHYNSSRHEWLFWCARTGKGDLDEARKLAVGWAELARGTRDVNQLLLSAATFALCDKPEEALQALQPVLGGASVDRRLGLFAALLADEVGKKKERDELLAKIVKQTDAPPKPAEPAPKPKTPAPKAPDPVTQAKAATMFKGCGELARLFAQALAASPGGQGVDLKQVDEAIAAVDPEHQITVKYFAARYLELHGHPAGAKKLYGEVAAVGTRSVSVALAAYRLRNLKP
jgi:tetratricopeptide (TPR) repeat protein